jgi:predicted small secreted protein
MKRLTELFKQSACKMAMAIASLLILGLTGCNTVRGVGEDVSAIGQSMADTARNME